MNTEQQQTSPVDSRAVAQPAEHDNAANAAGNQAERVLRPAVDIYEDEQGIRLIADLPGVPKDALDVQIDGDTLWIQADARIRTPDNMEAVHADVTTTRFRRSFTLSKELDTTAISAELNAGVLTLSLPKRAELQPRKIEVSVG